MDFTNMDIYTITAGTGSDGTRYLQLFLQEYTKLFNEKVTPSCPKCLNKYLTRYKNYYTEMENTCAYRLHAKYENIPLEFGSAILVNNSNIKDEYAQKLLEQENGHRFFAVIPSTGRPAKPKRRTKKQHASGLQEPSLKAIQAPTNDTSAEEVAE